MVWEQREKWQANDRDPLTKAAGTRTAVLSSQSGAPLSCRRTACQSPKCFEPLRPGLHSGRLELSSFFQKGIHKVPTAEQAQF